MSRVIDKRAMGPFNLAAEPPVGRDDIAAALGARPVHIPSGVLGALVDLSWRARLQHIDRGWLDMAFTVPLIGLLALSPRTRLGSEMNLDGRLGRCPGWRRAPDSHRQPTFAATLDARSSATRGDRGVDLIASAALSADRLLGSSPTGRLHLRNATTTVIGPLVCASFTSGPIASTH